MAWMRLPIDPGKRWIAGFCTHTATKSSSLIAAIFEGVEVIAVPEPIAQRPGACERPLHRHLLIEQHADQQRRAVAVEQPVGLRIAGDVRRSGHQARAGLGASMSVSSGHLPIAIATLPQSGSAPCTAVFTSGEFTIDFATRRDCARSSSIFEVFEQIAWAR